MSEIPSSSSLPPFPGQPPVEPRPPSPSQNFRDALWSATPVVWVTPLLIAVNVGVFGLMALGGAGILSSNLNKMIAWGAGFGPLTTHGQSWRLLTEIFLHFGILHLAMNMFVFWQAGPLVERLFGNLSFAVIYFLSGLCGSLLSEWQHPLAVAGGASGAVFGVYGALLGFLAVRRGAIPTPILKPLASSAAIFIAYNIIAGSAQNGIDVAAHLGGLGSGFVLGILLSRRLVRGEGFMRGVAAAIVGGGAVWILAHRLPVVADLTGELHHIDQVYSQAVKSYENALVQVKAGTMDQSRMASIIEDQVLPPIRSARAHVEGLQGVGNDPRAQKTWNLERTYIGQRQEQWEAALMAITHQNEREMVEATQQEREAEQTRQDLNHLP
jgi:rhomboid protease GluP